MRYRTLSQIAEMCDSLSEVAIYLAKSENNEARNTMLANCDKTVQAIASTLKAEENVDKLNDIIKDVEYIISILENKNEEANVNEFIVDIKRRMVNMVECQYKIVIFAELGEKWDSLESVYQGFLAKENCEVLIVLAPIFRENNGRQEVIYKDYFTPVGIPFIEYKDYDIEKEMPDLAFTCQPYESVTVPLFWAENIAKYTRLVYVPYFAAHMLYNASISTMCKMPIFQYAWKVIGSSQGHYKFYRKHALNRGKNMLVTGVPKWDGVIKLKNDGMVEKADDWGVKLKGKKVFLWNSFYELNTSSIHYWQAIMQYFLSHPDCGLIWRMHPMTKLVAKTYFGDEAEQTILTMENFAKNMQNVVVDTNTSYQKAFLYSHAQISDFSSMMTQYLLMDKPLLWLKNSKWQATECIIDNAWMETAENKDEIVEFFDRIRDDIDINKELRGIIRQRDIPLADGKAGERVCDITLELLRKETLGI